MRCDACPVLCRIRPGRPGACARYANDNGRLVRTDPVVLLARTVERRRQGRAVRGRYRGADWDGAMLDADRTFVTGVGAGTTYPDYKPAPFIVSAEHDGVDTVTVVTEGIFSYCGVKVKIDTDRHLGPETAAIRVEGEQVGHVTTAEYGSQMLSIGGVRHLTGGSKKEGNVTCDALLKLCSGEAVEMTIDGGHAVVVQAGARADRRRQAGGAHARRLRLGDRRHLRAAVARPCRRSDRGRRPHHRRADRAPGGARARHAAGRHPRARAQVDAGALLQGRGAGAWAGAAPTSPIRSRSSQKIDPEDRVAGPAPADDLDHGRGRALLRARREPEAACRRRCRQPVRKGGRAHRRELRAVAVHGAVHGRRGRHRCGPASPKTRCC